MDGKFVHHVKYRNIIPEKDILSYIVRMKVLVDIDLVD